MKKMFLILKETKRAAIISFLVIVATFVLIAFGINTITDFSDLSKSVQKEDNLKFAEKNDLFDQAYLEKQEKKEILTNIKNLPSSGEVKLKVDSIPQNFDIVAEYFRALSQKYPKNSNFERIFNATQQIADSAYRISDTFSSMDLLLQDVRFKTDEVALNDRINFEIVRINKQNQILKEVSKQLKDPDLIKIIEAENILSEKFIVMTRKQKVELDEIAWDEKELIEAIETVNLLIHDFIETTDKTVNVLEKNSQDYGNDKESDVVRLSKKAKNNNHDKKSVKAPQDDHN